MWNNCRVKETEKLATDTGLARVSKGYQQRAGCKHITNVTFKVANM